MTERDPIRRLEALGSTPVPPPSDALTDRLVADRLSSRDRARRVIRFPVVLPAAALAAAIVGLFLIAVNDDSSTMAKTIVLENAVDASVERSGSAAPARTGSTLLEGAVVTVGPSGSVRAGGTTLGPGERAVVRAGRLQRLQAARAIAAEWQQLPVAVELRGRRTARGIVTLSWAAYEGDGAAATYVVFREDHRVVTRRALGGRLVVVDRDAPAATRYLVVVLDAERRPIARSQLVAP